MRVCARIKFHFITSDDEYLHILCTSSAFWKFWMWFKSSENYYRFVIDRIRFIFTVIRSKLVKLSRRMGKFSYIYSLPSFILYRAKQKVKWIVKLLVAIRTTSIFRDKIDCLIVPIRLHFTLFYNMSPTFISYFNIFKANIVRDIKYAQTPDI